MRSLRAFPPPSPFPEESMAALIDAITVKRKMYFEFENVPYYCLEAEVSTPTARGGQTLVRLKMRNLLTRAVFDKTFKAGDMDAAQKAAQDLIDNLDKYLAPENKPANVADAQWTQIKQTMLVQAHMELAAVSASKKDDAKTEAEHRKVDRKSTRL